MALAKSRVVISRGTFLKGLSRPSSPPPDPLSSVMGARAWTCMQHAVCVVGALERPEEELCVHMRMIRQQDTKGGDSSSTAWQQHGPGGDRTLTQKRMNNPKCKLITIKVPP